MNALIHVGVMHFIEVSDRHNYIEKIEMEKPEIKKKKR